MSREAHVRFCESAAVKFRCATRPPTERFFRSLKSERLSDCRFATRKNAYIEILDYITYYNAYRLHSTLGYKTPLEFEKALLLNAA